MAGGAGGRAAPAWGAGAETRLDARLRPLALQQGWTGAGLGGPSQRPGRTRCPAARLTSQPHPPPNPSCQAEPSGRMGAGGEGPPGVGAPLVWGL